jgi:hypothetical protein
MAKIRLDTQALAGSISNGLISATAAIDYSKLNLSGLIDTTDLNFTIPADSGDTWYPHEVPTGDINGTNDVYTIATAPKGYKVWPVLNGVQLFKAAAASANTVLESFFMASASAVLFTIGAAPETGDYLEVSYVA